VTFRVAEDRDNGDLIGLSAFLKRRPQMKPALEEYADAVQLALIAVRDRYRGVRMHNGARIGVFLLCDALDQIEPKRGNPMPPVWASVHRDNEPCKRHVIRTLHRFWPMRTEGAYLAYFRDGGEASTRGFTPSMIDAVKMASIDRP
jgi:hypothetical protein